MNATHYTGWLCAAIFCVVWVSWYSVRQSASIFDGSMVSAEAIDAHVIDLTVQQFDKQGREQQYIQSPLVQRIPIKQQHVFKQPHIMLTQNNAPSWNIDAAQAIALRGGQEMMFTDHVVISRSAEPNSLSNGDANAPMLMHADQVLFNQLTHLGVYTGHVTIDQGATHIQSTAAQTQVDAQNKLQHIELKGHKKDQVHYSSVVKNKPDVHAYADNMQYFPQRHMIQFIGHARLTQGNNFFSAPMIMYDTLSQHMVSSSNGSIVRTTIVIHPENYS